MCFRNLRDDLKRKADRILILTTESNMYQVEVAKIRRVMEGMNVELNAVSLFLLVPNNSQSTDKAEISGG